MPRKSASAIEEPNLNDENDIAIEISEDEEKHSEEQVPSEPQIQSGGTSNDRLNIMLNSAPETTVKMANREQRRALYTDEVVPISDKLDIETIGDENHRVFLELTQSLKAKKILTGTVDGVVQLKVGEKNFTLAAVIHYGGDYIIYIPLKYFLRKETLPEEIHGNSSAQLNFMRMLMNQRIGAEVDFIISAIDEYETKAVANRVEAMNLKRREYYLTRSRRDSTFKVNLGQKVEARVIYATSIGIGIEAFGVEQFLRAHEISYNRISDVSDYYMAGDKVQAKVIALERSRENFQVTFSVKDAKENPKIKFFDNFDVGGTYRAEITQIDSNGIFVLLLGQVDALCPFPKSNEPLAVGDIVQVLVTKKQESDYRIYCEFRKRMATRHLN